MTDEQYIQIVARLDTLGRLLSGTKYAEMRDIEVYDQQTKSFEAAAAERARKRDVQKRLMEALG